MHYKLCESTDVVSCLQCILRWDNSNYDTSEMNDDIMDDLVQYLIGTYCRMRGKDFCSQIMATDFKNLGKGFRPTIAVLSDKLSYTKKEVKDVATTNSLQYSLFDELTTFHATNTILDANEEHDIIQEDELINIHIV